MYIFYLFFTWYSFIDVEFIGTSYFLFSAPAPSERIYCSELLGTNEIQLCYVAGLPTSMLTKVSLHVSFGRLRQTNTTDTIPPDASQILIY